MVDSHCSAFIFDLRQDGVKINFYGGIANSAGHRLEITVFCLTTNYLRLTTNLFLISFNNSIHMNLRGIEEWNSHIRRLGEY